MTEFANNWVGRNVIFYFKSDKTEMKHKGKIVVDTLEETMIEREDGKHFYGYEVYYTLAG